MKHKRRWPFYGRKKQEILNLLKSSLEKNICYSSDNIMGFPGSSPLDISVEASALYMKKHPNHIGTHTSDISEKGFPGSQEIEREVIGMLAEISGARLEDVHGYLASGGTEGNIMGILLAREYFKSLNDDKICIITSFFTHYSIRKASWILGISDEYWKKCELCSAREGKVINHYFESVDKAGHMELVGCDESGRIGIEQTIMAIKQNYQNGFRNFVLVLSESNVMTGAVDEINIVAFLVEKLKADLPGTNFYIHVDSAFGGFVLPFLYPDRVRGFQIPEVDSVSIDPHKMGLVPYPAGTFLYRKDERNFRSMLGVDMGYVPGDTDGTLVGSRPGATAAACYAAFSNLGFSGYQKMIKTCYENTLYLRERLLQIPWLHVFDSDVNVVAFSLKDGENLSSEIVNEFMLVHHFYPLNFSKPDDHVRQIYKVTVMPHLTKTKIDQFVERLKNEK